MKREPTKRVYQLAISDTMKKHFKRINFTIDDWLKSELTYYYLQDFRSQFGYNAYYPLISEGLRDIIKDSDDEILKKQIEDFIKDEDAFYTKYSHIEAFNTKFHKIPHPFKKGDILRIKTEPQYVYIVLDTKFDRSRKKFYEFGEDGFKLLRLSDNGTFSYINHAVSPIMFDYADNYTLKRVIGERYCDL